MADKRRQFIRSLSASDPEAVTQIKPTPKASVAVQSPSASSSKPNTFEPKDSSARRRYISALASSKKQPEEQPAFEEPSLPKASSCVSFTLEKLVEFQDTSSAVLMGASDSKAPVRKRPN